MDERRKHKRYPVKISAGIYFPKQPGKVIDAEVLDISVGGAFVNCTEALPSGMEVLVELRFGELWTFEGKIVRNDRALANLSQPSVVRWTTASSKPGFGIEFQGLDPEKRKDLQYLMTVLEERIQERAKSKKK